MDGLNAVEPAPALRLLGASNFRDFGGYATRDGRMVRRGKLYRSNDLFKLTADDLEQLRPLSIRLICDLRGDAERVCRPSRWLDDMPAERLLADLSPSPDAGNRHYETDFADVSSADTARMVMADIYRRLPVKGAGSLAEIAGRLARDDTPVLIHCTAGKDRTGFVCAILLEILGVPRETIFADYLRTAELLDLDEMIETLESLREAFPTFPRSLPREALDVVNSVERQYLEAAFETLERRHGSVDGYLQSIGVDAATQQRLREVLLEPAAS